MIRIETTAYGSAALERLRDVVAELKGGDPMAQVVIVAPSNLAGTVARRYLARQGARAGARSPGVAGLEVTTIHRLAERLAATSLAPRRPATGPVLAAAWRAALAHDAGIFAEVADHTATVEALATAHRELRDLDGRDLDTLAASGRRTTQDLIRLHRAVVAALRPGWYDTHDLLDAAAAHVGTGNAVAAPVVLYLPQDLTRPERRLVDALAAAADVVVVAGLTGTERGDAHLREWELPGAPPPEPTARRILNASDCDDEVRCVVRDVVAALHVGTPAERVAVLYAARDPYARLLHEHLAAAGVRVNGPGSRPVAERALARTVLELFALAENDVPRSDLFRALAGAPLRDFTGARVPVTAWERVSREAGIVRGDDWDVRLAEFVARQDRVVQNAAADDERPWVADRARRNVETGAALLAFTTHLRGELARAADLSTWRELAVWALDLVTALVGEPHDLLHLPPEEQHAAARVTEVLRGLAVLDEVAAPATLGALVEVLKSELTRASDRVGKVGDGVLVAPVAAAVGLDLDAVHVVGLSEDLYPGRPRTDALLPDVVRQAVAPLRTTQTVLDTRLRYLCAAFAAAPEPVGSFPRGDLRSSSHRLPSRWLLPSLRELARDAATTPEQHARATALAATEWDRVGEVSRALVTSPSFATALLRAPTLATRGEWGVRAAFHGELDEVARAARDLLVARASDGFTRFDGNLAGAVGLPDYAHDERAVAPTTLERYAECPHAFFVGRLLRVAPLQQPEELVTISPLEVGHVIHRAYDRLVRDLDERGALPGPGEPWSAQARDELVRLGREEGAGLERQGLTGHPRLWAAERDRIEHDLLAMLDADDRWRAERGAAVVASELLFGFVKDGSLPPVDVPLPTGGHVRLRGSADKVDVGADGTVYVTDIKTGSQRPFRDIDPDADPFAAGTKLQLPVYGIAARDRFGAGTAAVEAAYWFVRKDPGWVQVPLSPAVERAYAATLGVLVGSVAAGLFPQRPPAAPDFAFVQCPYCNPDGVGHGAARDRWERKWHAPELAELVALLEPGALPDGDPEGGAGAAP